DFFRDHCGPSCTSGSPSCDRRRSQQDAEWGDEEDAFIQGIQAASGVAIGTVALLDPLANLESIPDREAQDVDAEETTFRTAVADVQRELSETVGRLAPGLSKDVRALFDVYIML